MEIENKLLLNFGKELCTTMTDVVKKKKKFSKKKMFLNFESNNNKKIPFLQMLVCKRLGLGLGIFF